MVCVRVGVLYVYVGVCVSQATAQSDDHYVVVANRRSRVERGRAQRKLRTLSIRIEFTSMYRVFSLYSKSAASWGGAVIAAGLMYATGC